jgi:NADPH:quinone reductase-like Zn-dependent oxidoreductase
VIDYRASPDWADPGARAHGWLWRGSGGSRVGGPGTLAQSVKAIAYGGQVSLVGALAGMAGGIDFMTMFLSQATYQPIATGSRRDLEDLCRVMEQHQIRPVIDSVFSLEDAKAGLRHYAGRKVIGKVVIRH